MELLTASVSLPGVYDRRNTHEVVRSSPRYLLCIGTPSLTEYDALPGKSQYRLTRICMILQLQYDMTGQMYQH